MIWSGFVLLAAVCTVSTEFIDVKTPLGTITGIGLPVTGMPSLKTYQFKRIPYAKPPLGDLRFRKPVPYGSWGGTYNGTYFGPSCMQIPNPYSIYLLPNRNMSEDCLVLNIYVPNSVNVSISKAVMVWIHGGAYETGTGMIYDASYMAAKADVIVVTVNYRLGIFGFFTLNNSAALGNYGIWDQKLALQWVNKYIAYFGGDNNQVTIFGESAGGFSVGLHTLIPSNRGLFQRAIAESGVALSSFAMTSHEGKDISILMGELLGCHYGTGSSSDISKFMQCVRNASAHTIVRYTTDAEKAPTLDVIQNIPLAPVIDGDLFSDSPLNLLSNPESDAYKFFKSLDIIVGNVNSEGSLLLLNIPGFQKRYGFDLNKGVPQDIFCGKIAKQFADVYFDRDESVSSAVCKEYGRKDEAEQARQLVNMYTDFFFLVPSVNTLQFHTGNQTNHSTYQYIFTQRCPVPFGPKRPPWWVGSGHASELSYLFGIRDLPKINITVTKEDLILSDKMISYWTNFAKNGNPNYGVPTNASLPEWTPFDGVSRRCMRLNYNVTLIADYDADRIKFWTEKISAHENKRRKHTH